MEALTNFLKHGTNGLDWLVLLVMLVLCVVALLLLFVLRSSKPFIVVTASALIPLAGGLLSTFLKYQQARRVLEIADAGSEVIESAQAEAWIITYIAAVGTIIIAGLGLIGMFTKRRAAG